MKRWRDIGTEMFDPVVDARTEERMFLGLLEPREAPVEYAGVVAVLRAARSASVMESGADLRERVVASMVAVISSGPSSELSVAVPPPTLPAGSRRGPVPFLPRLRLVGALVVGFLAASVGLAFAGALPGPAQGVASSLFAHVGIHVPNHHGGAAPHATIPPKGSTTPAGRGLGPGRTKTPAATWPGRGNHKGWREHRHGGDQRHGRDGKGREGDHHRPSDHHSGRDRGGRGSHGSDTDGHGSRGHGGDGSGHGRGGSSHGRTNHHHSQGR